MYTISVFIYNVMLGVRERGGQLKFVFVSVFQLVKLFLPIMNESRAQQTEIPLFHGI